MPATRKVAHVSQDQDLAQLKNIFAQKQNTETEPVVSEKNSEPVKTAEIVSEIKKSLTGTGKEILNPEVSADDDKKSVTDTTVGIRMNSAKKQEMKAYFIQHGTTMSQGVLDAFTLLRELEARGIVEYKDGVLAISKS